MHTLTKARLIAGSQTPVGDGVTGASRCVLEDATGRKRAAVLKEGTPAEVASEALAALLLSAWGLPVPEPFLVDVNGAIAFASADVSYPSLKQRLFSGNIHGPALEAASLTAMRIVCGFGSTPKAAACDEAIDNRDRNLGNVLWDGSSEAWIDHAYCFGVGGLEDQNKLCDMAIAIGEIESMQRGAIAAAMSLDRTAPQKALDHAEPHQIPIGDHASLACQRLSSLGQRLLARFPQPTDLLTGAA